MGKVLMPLEFEVYGNKLINLLWILKNVVTFIHRNRESNHIVDGLAKKGSTPEGLRVKWYFGSGVAPDYEGGL